MEILSGSDRVALEVFGTDWHCSNAYRYAKSCLLSYSMLDALKLIPFALKMFLKNRPAFRDGGLAELKSLGSPA